MKFKIVDFADETNNDYDIFMKNIQSNLVMDFNKNEIIENNEWIDEILFTVPYLIKAFQNAKKQIKTEEEILKTELVKKVSVESVRHLAKHVNMVQNFDKNSGEVIPEKLLNINREETYITYENRFLYSLVCFIEDFITIRNKIANEGKNAKGKIRHLARYEAKTQFKKERVTYKMEYLSEKRIAEESAHDLELKINQIEDALKAVKATDLYKLLKASEVRLVNNPLKMTNILLKNVNYHYAVKLWNYLNENFDLKNKTNNLNKEIDNNRYCKELMDESLLLNYIVFSQINSKENSEGNRKILLTREEQKELSDELMKKLFELYPTLAEREIKDMIAKRYIQYQKTAETSTKPIKEKFKEEINTYLTKIDKMRIK